MNNIGSIKNEINKILRILIEDNISMQQNFPEIKENGSIKKLEWSSITNLSVSLKNQNYSHIYSEIDKNNDYTIKFLDGNIIQILYTFQNNKLISHRLAMFPSPNLETFQNNPEIYEKDIIYADILSKKVVAFPIRFDYNKEVITSEDLHPHSHVTLGQYTNCRIPAYGPISPKIFLEFILENFYNTYYTRIYSKKNIKKNCNNLITITPEECNKLHFNFK